MKERTSLPKLQNLKNYKEGFIKQFYISKLDNLREVNEFLDVHKLPIMAQEEIHNLNRPITCKETELVIKNFLKLYIYIHLLFNSTKCLAELALRTS